MLYSERDRYGTGNSGLIADRALAIALSLDNTQRFLLSPPLFRYIKAFLGKIVSFSFKSASVAAI